MEFGGLAATFEAKCVAETEPIQMKIPSFHDGSFDGFRLHSNSSLHIFLRTADKVPHTLALEGVQALTISEVKEGNIIFDLVFRDAQQATPSDIAELYEVSPDSEQSKNLLRSAHDKKLRILELNSSHGAHGLILFETGRIKED